MMNVVSPSRRPKREAVGDPWNKQDLTAKYGTPPVARSVRRSTTDPLSRRRAMSPSLTAHCPTAIYFSSPRRESSTMPTANKTVLITGANTGIGKEAARQLAQRGDYRRICLACRDLTKAAAAQKDLERSTKRDVFKVVPLDLAGSEAARGARKVGVPVPKFTDHSVKEFSSVIEGSFFDHRRYKMALAYGQSKYLGVLWMNSLARRYPELRLLTVSPGSTSGTEAARDMPAPLRLFITKFFQPIVATRLHLAHQLEIGAPSAWSTGSPTPSCAPASSTPALPARSSDR